MVTLFLRDFEANMVSDALAAYVEYLIRHRAPRIEVDLCNDLVHRCDEALEAEKTTGTVVKEPEQAQRSGQSVGNSETSGALGTYGAF